MEINVGGFKVVGPSSVVEIFKKRDDFVQKYCLEKGWKFSELTLDQILEIRKQEGWKNP